MNRPFEANEYLSGHSVAKLVNWLEANADKVIHLSPDYTVRDMICDLHGIVGGIWSDGIDSMGEDVYMNDDLKKRLEEQTEYHELVHGPLCSEALVYIEALENALKIIRARAIFELEHPTDMRDTVFSIIYIEANELLDPLQDVFALDRETETLEKVVIDVKDDPIYIASRRLP